MHSECIRCGKMTNRSYQARTTCIFCIEFYKLEDAFATLKKSALEAEAKVVQLEATVRNLWETSNA